MPRSVTLTLDLLNTFLLLVRYGGDAGRAAHEIGINQPSMSKRLRYFHHAGLLLERPWIQREGKSWSLTEEGERVLPAVEQIIARHDQLTKFISEPVEPRVRFACGQQAVQGFVRNAVRAFRKRHPDTQLHVETMRGAARIEGVANGALELATATHAEADIHRIARRELHVEELCEDRLVLVCSEKCEWSAAVRKLPKTKVKADALTDFPLILPNRDSGLRQWFDTVLRQEGVFSDMNLILETGGWSTILAYVQDGFGVGLISDTAAKIEKRIIVRQLDPSVFPTRVTRLICRWLDAREEALDLSAEAVAFRESLLRFAR